MSLKTDVYGLLNNAVRLCDGCAEAQEILSVIKSMQSRLDEPLRVAVVGMMKAGKSTLLNSILGKDILDTDTLEATYTISWFKYGEKPRLKICFRDGSEEMADFNDLDKWTTRRSKSTNDKLDDVKYVLIYYPSEILKKMEFVDTPGLNSYYGTDAQNTLDFLEIKSSEATLTEASSADAVIYAFSRSASGFDKNILDAFSNGNTTSSPINSIGVLTKVDATGIWQVEDDITPTKKAKAVTAKIMENSDMKKQLFSVIPVCSKPVEGFEKIGDEEFAVLEKMAQIDTEDLQDFLFDANSFANEDDECYSILGPKEKRALLLKCVDKYGILEITKQIKNGKTKDEIRETLRTECGITEIQNVIKNHFGSRTFLVKAQYIFGFLRSALHKIKKSVKQNSDLYNICDQIKEDIDELVSSHQRFCELKALQMYYNGQLLFEDEEEKADFLCIMGETEGGRSTEARLGVTENVPISELKNIARKKANLWNGKAAYIMMANSYIMAASVVARSYEEIYFHLEALDEE